MTVYQLDESGRVSLGAVACVQGVDEGEGVGSAVSVAGIKPAHCESAPPAEVEESVAATSTPLPSTSTSDVIRLHDSAREGRLEEVLRLLAEGEDKDSKDQVSSLDIVYAKLLKVFALWTL